MSWAEIILGIFFIITKTPDIEEILGQSILDNSAGNPFYSAIWITIKLLPLLGFLALIDGILRQFNFSLWKILVKGKDDIEEYITQQSRGIQLILEDILINES